MNWIVWCWAIGLWPWLVHALSDKSDTFQYPDKIYPVALRVYHDTIMGTKLPVSTDRLSLLGAVPPDVCDLKHVRRSSKRVPREELKRLLQCAKNEPDLDEHTGSISMMQRIPVTRETIELAAIWAETRCQPWERCQQLMLEYHNGTYDKNKFGVDKYDGFRQFRMYRIVNGVLFEDWPFGPLTRLDQSAREYHDGYFQRHLALIEYISAKASDMPNATFFMGTEQPFLPWNVPFPAFSPTAQLGYGNIPWPWMESVRDAYKVSFMSRRENMGSGANNETVIEHLTGQLPWAERLSKAAYFGSWSPIRQYAFDAATADPDLFDVAFGLSDAEKIFPVNPTLREEPVTSKDAEEFFRHPTSPSNSEQPAGSAKALLPFAKSRPYQPGHYKYVVVMLAMDGAATSGRLAELLAHSGAVILLQEGALRYHFSARLIPWVHYVPLSYSSADLVRKVRWLRDHDELAQQLAANARAFARSYLRIEDYYCYALHAMEAVASGMGDDADDAFSPREVSNRDCRM